MGKCSSVPIFVGGTMNGDTAENREMLVCPQFLLEEYRRVIDGIDLQLLALLNERTRVVEKIGEVKQQAAMPIYEPKREDQVYRNVLENNGGPLPEDAVKRIFERIIDEMRTLQKTRMQRSGS